MQSQLAVGLASAAVGAMAIAVSGVTSIRSIQAQRESTRATLKTQRLLATTQERALRDRSHDEWLRSHRAPVYAYLLRWLNDLLSSLDLMSEESPALARARWHIEPAMEDELDLYSSDVVQIQFSALRGLLLSVVEGYGPGDWPLVTWEEVDGRMVNVDTSPRPPLADWPERARVLKMANTSGIDLIAKIRAEIQGREHSGHFLIYRLDRE